MSARKKSGSRRSRFVWMTREDRQTSMLSFFSPKPRGRKRKMPPRKITTRRPAARSPAQSTSSEVVLLDDTPESVEIRNNVNTKVGTFMQTGSFISSDEDEAEMIKTKSNKKFSSSAFFISDDSDDDCKLSKQSGATLNFDDKPSTSAGPSSDSTTDIKSKNIDDIMGFVDSVSENTSASRDENKSDCLKDMKSLEDYRKETEAMLKNASSLLQEIKTGNKTEPEPEKSPTKTIGGCPICLESLANRPTAVTVCGHIFCMECIRQTAQTLKKCPTCRKSINAKKIHPIYL